MDIIQLKTASEIRDDIIAEICALTSISDANLGSTTRTIAYSVAVELDELYFQLWRATKAFYIKASSGVALDNRGRDFGLARLAAARARGYVTFTGPDPAPGSTVVPIGTQVAVPATATEEEVVFETTMIATITAGNTTVNAPIRALLPGSDGSVGTGQITYLKTSVSGVTSVSNAANTTLGTDEEDDAAFRERILRTFEGLSKGTIPAILHGTLDFAVQKVTLDGDLGAAAVEIPVREDLNLFPFSVQGTGIVVLGNSDELIQYGGIDTTTIPHRFTGLVRAAPVDHTDGTSVTEYIPTSRGSNVTSAKIVEGLGRVDVYIHDGTHTGACAELVDLVQRRLRGDGTDRDPGYKGAGILLDVHACTVISISVTAYVVVRSDYDAVATKNVAQLALISYLDGLKAGEDVRAYELVEAIMTVNGIENITSMTVHSVPFVGTTSADVSIAVNEVARANTPSGVWVY